MLRLLRWNHRIPLKLFQAPTDIYYHLHRFGAVEIVHGLVVVVCTGRCVGGFSGGRVGFGAQYIFFVYESNLHSLQNKNQLTRQKIENLPESTVWSCHEIFTVFNVTFVTFIPDITIANSPWTDFTMS